MGYQRDWLDEQGQKVKDERAERKVFESILHNFGSRVEKKSSDSCSVNTLLISLLCFLWNKISESCA